MKRNGFAPIAIALLALAGIVILGAGAYYYFRGSSNPPVVQGTQPGNGNPPVAVTTSTPPIVTPSSTPTSTSSKPPTTTPSSTAQFIMMPDNGPVGTPVTVYGSGFAATGNTVTINGMVSGSLKNITSNGGSIKFTIPSSIGPNCNPNEMCPQYLLEVTPRVYTIAIISNGVTRTVGSFTVTASGTPIGL